ncbi:MAG: CGNR zinc finger domain-containing protein [Candidatus Acidiferrum sp.]
MTEREYLRHGFGKFNLWLDFVNSLEHDGLGHTTDHLQDPEWRGSFLRRWKLSAPPRQALPVASLLRLRAMLRVVAEKSSSPEPLKRSEFRALDAAMSVWVRPHLFQRQNGLLLEYAPRQNDWRSIQAKIAESLARTLVESSRERIKICPDPLCRWIFYDKTKGKTRVWCNEKTCGNRNRVRRSRAANK